MLESVNGFIKGAWVFPKKVLDQKKKWAWRELVSHPILSIDWYWMPNN